MSLVKMSLSKFDVKQFVEETKLIVKKGQGIPAEVIKNTDPVGLAKFDVYKKTITNLEETDKHRVMAYSLYDEATGEINITLPAYCPGYERKMIESKVRNSMRQTKVLVRLRNKVMERGGIPNEFGLR